MESGTKTGFRTFLANHGFTHTAYTKQAIPVKAELYKKYLATKKKGPVVHEAVDTRTE